MTDQARREHDAGAALDDRGPGARKLPLWLKLAFSLFLCELGPTYWVYYGPGNYLWFCDIALVLTAVSLWTEKPLPANMAALAVALMDGLWSVAFLVRLLGGPGAPNYVPYMFDPWQSLFLRGLSLFHLFMPPLLLWLTYRLGYDRRALAATTLMAWIVLPVTYWTTRPGADINWVFGPAWKIQTAMHPGVYLLLMMAAYPLLIYLPTHVLLRRLFASDRR